MAWRWPRPWRRRAGLGLALQGGGAHGAFTWGVLDALLEHGGLPDIVAISGTSAGAMNAVVLAQGLLEGGAEGGRSALARFWHAVGTQLPFDWITQGDGHDTALTPLARWWLQWSRMISPYQRLSIEPDPLRALVEAQIDFARLRATPGPALHIAATRADNGRLRLFRRHELTADTLLASACLPLLQPAVMVDGAAYWDGGYSANPALYPLVDDPRAEDLLLVMLSPWHFGELPTTSARILERAADIGFNAGFLREMQALAQARRHARQGLVWRSAGEARHARLRWHLIDGHGTLAALAPDSRLIAHRPFLEHLRDAGRQRALAWLARHGSAVGRQASADIEALFGADTPPAVLAEAAA